MQDLSLAIMGTLFSSLTLANTGLSTQVDLTAAPIEALIIGVQTTFRLVAVILIAAVILGVFSWWKSPINQE